MAFNNPYYSYQNYPNYNQQYSQPAQDQLMQYRQQPVNQDERIWVQGEGAAQAYLMAPRSFVRLWDSLSPVFYEKRTDESGRPYMETYEYCRKGAQAPAVNVTQATVDYESQIKALEDRIKALEERGVADVQ